MKLGLNLTGTSFFHPDMPFIDRMKASGDWTSGTPVDAEGWPLAGANGTDATQCSIRMSDVLTDYIIRWEGGGTVRPAFNNVGGVQVGNEYRVSTARNVGATSIPIKISGFDTANPTRKITVVPAALDALFQAGEIFDPAYVERIRNLDTVRFMDWLRTNSSTLTGPGPSSAPQRSWIYGVPIPVCVALAQKAGVRGWINIPDLATDGAIRQICAMVPVGWPIEWSNEVWNVDFDQATRAKAAGGGTTAGHATYVGTKMANVATIAAEFGHKLMVGWQPTTNPSGWNTWEAAYVAAGGPPANVMTSAYLAGGLNSIAALTPYEQNDDIAGVHAVLLADVEECRKRFINARNVANRIGGEPSIYEGYIHLNTSPGVDTMVPFVARIQRDPGVRAVMEALFAAANDEGIATFNIYNQSGAPSRAGYFGITDTPTGELVDEMRLAAEGVSSLEAATVLGLAMAGTVTVAGVVQRPLSGAAVIGITGIIGDVTIVPPVSRLIVGAAALALAGAGALSVVPAVQRQIAGAATVTLAGAGAISTAPAAQRLLMSGASIALAAVAVATVKVSAATPKPKPGYDTGKKQGNLMPTTPSRVIYADNAINPAWPAKYPSEILDYGYAPKLEAGEIVTLANASSWQDGPTIERIEIADDGVTLWISGGTGATYGAIEIAMETLTAAGVERQFVAEVELRIRDIDRVAPTLIGLLRSRVALGLDATATIISTVPARVNLFADAVMALEAGGQPRVVVTNALQGDASIGVTIAGRAALGSTLAGAATLAITGAGFAANAAAGLSPLVGAVTASLASAATIATARALTGGASLGILSTGSPLIVSNATPVYRMQNTRTYGSSTHVNLHVGDEFNIRGDAVPPEFVGVTWQTRATQIVPTLTGKTIVIVKIGNATTDPENSTFGPAIRARIGSDISLGLLTPDTKVTFGNGNAGAGQDDMDMITSDIGILQDLRAAGIQKVTLSSIQYKPDEIASAQPVQIFNRRQSWFRVNATPNYGLLNFHEGHMRAAEDPAIAAVLLPDDYAKLAAGRRPDSLVSIDDNHDIATGYRAIGNYYAKVEAGLEGGLPFIGTLDYFVRTTQPGYLTDIQYVGDVAGCTVTTNSPGLSIQHVANPNYPATSPWPRLLQLSCTTIPTRARLPVQITVSKPGYGSETYRIFLSVSERTGTAPAMKRIRNAVELFRTLPYGMPAVGPSPYFPANSRKLSFCLIMRMEANDGLSVYGTPAGIDNTRNQHVMALGGDSKTLVSVRRTASTAINVTILDDTNGGSVAAINASIGSAFSLDHGWRAFFVSYDADQPEKCAMYASGGKRISGAAYSLATTPITPGGSGTLGLARPTPSVTDGLYLFTASSSRYSPDYLEASLWNFWWANEFVDFSIKENRELFFNEATQTAVDLGNARGEVLGIKPFIYLPNSAAEMVAGFYDYTPEEREGGVSCRNFGTHPNGNPAPGFVTRVVGQIEHVRPTPGVLVGAVRITMTPIATPTVFSSSAVAAKGSATLGLAIAGAVGNAPPAAFQIFGAAAIEMTAVGAVTFAAAEDADATALMARMAPAPTTTRRGQINALVSSLKVAGVWAKLDWFAILAAHSEQAARLNWKPGSKALTPGGGVENMFAVDRGYTGDGVGAYLTTNEVAATAGAQYTRFSACIGAYAATVSAADQYVVGAIEATSPLIRGKTTEMRTSIHGSQGTFATSAVGHLAMSRLDDVSHRSFKNGVSLGDTAGTTITTLRTPAILRSTTSYSSQRVAAFYLGAGLTDSEMASLHAALDKYLGEVGAK